MDFFDSLDKLIALMFSICQCLRDFCSKSKVFIFKFDNLFAEFSVSSATWALSSSWLRKNEKRSVLYILTHCSSNFLDKILFKADYKWFLFALRKFKTKKISQQRVWLLKRPVRGGLTSPPPCEICLKIEKAPLFERPRIIHSRSEKLKILE